MIFICTCSQDVTTDILLPYLHDVSTFRFNIDCANDYSWDFTKCGFSMKDVKQGQAIDSSTITSFYLRKPIFFNLIDIPKEGCLENWCREEIVALFEDFYRENEFNRRATLVHSHNSNYGKLRQLRIAENYFKVANWHFFHGALPQELKTGRWVVKSITDNSIGKGKAFFVREIDPAKLDLAYPWFVQEKISGEDEVTVVYVDGELFAYSFPRTSIDASDDVRKATFEHPTEWRPCELSKAEQNAIRRFMADTNYRFGRFDFIRKDGELWFLELNPNGQWAWLDQKNERGLISAIADAIVTEDRSHQRAAAFLRPSP